MWSATLQWHTGVGNSGGESRTPPTGLPSCGPGRPQPRRRGRPRRLDIRPIPGPGAETQLSSSPAIEDLIVKPLSAKGKLRTARLAVSALSPVHRSALKDRTLGLIGNPCAGVEIGRMPRRPVQPLTPEERAKFREAIEGTEYEALWLLLMFTGLSPNEALALGWVHVDLRAGLVRVERTVDCKTRELVEDAKRPARRRTVPLAAELRAMLLEPQMAAGGSGAGGLVFPGRDGRPLDLDNLRSKHFRPALTTAKIDRPLRIYDLRHGFATSGLEAGLDVKDVATLMGHSSTRTTQDVYQHVSEERKREAADRIAAKLGS